MDAKLTHDVDQAVAGMRALGAGCAAMFAELLRGGMLREEALALVIAQVSALRRPENDPRKDAG